MKKEHLFTNCIAALFFIAFFEVFACKPTNLFQNDKTLQYEHTSESFKGKPAVWDEVNRTGFGYAESEMNEDSTYNMRTTDGWIMKIKYDRLTWAP